MANRHPNWNNSDWKFSPPAMLPPGSLRDHERWLLSVFHALLRRYGEDTARQMFANLVIEPNETQLKEREQFDTLRRLDAMKPRPNINQLVRDMLEEQGIKPSHEGYQNQSKALDRKIRRWKKQRPEIEGKFGATSPPLGPGQAATYRLHSPKKRTSR